MELNIAQIVLFQYIFGHAFPYIGYITQIANIFDTHRTGIKACCSKVAHPSKEYFSLVQLRFGLAYIRYLFQYFQLLGTSATNKRLSVIVQAM